MTICFLPRTERVWFLMEAGLGGGGRKTLIKIDYMKNTVFNKTEESYAIFREKRIKVISIMESKFENTKHYY